ncbi:MAG: sugar phosphate isomerase/epimerase family protein [Planctomycetota bacterium]|jgi:sugar phosphate isomerase/epimerase
MKPGIVCPSPLCAELADCPKAAEAGAKAIVARPALFVDDSFGLKVDPDGLAAGLSGAGLELAAVWAALPVVDSGGDAEAGAAHVRSCLDLADALRDYASPDALPVVVFDAGAGERDAVWPKLVEALKGLGADAEERQVVLAVRPDRESVVDRARNAVKLLGEVGSGYVQAALDAAATVGKDTLDAAIDKLKDNIVLAFARDVKFDDDGKPSYLPPGQGMINFEEYVKMLAAAPGCASLAVGELDSADDATAALGKIAGLVG